MENVQDIKNEVQLGEYKLITPKENALKHGKKLELEM